MQTIKKLKVFWRLYYIWMSLVFFVVFCVAPTPQSIVLASSPFSDVEINHWSYSTLAEFADAGFIEGYTKETFSGDRSITRYEMAWAVSRVDPMSLSTDDLSLYLRLQEEFKEELLFLKGENRNISYIGENVDSFSSAESNSNRIPTFPPIITYNQSEPGGGGKRLSEILDPERTQSDGITFNEPEKKISIPFDAGAHAELSLGGTGSRLGQIPGEGEDVIARLDLKYALSQLAIFRASYELSKDDEFQEGKDADAARATALLGIDYNFNVSDSAFVKAGYSYSRTQDVSVPKGVRIGGSGDLEQLDSGSKSAGFFGDYSMPGLSLDARKHIASLGVGYTFGGTASVVLGYKLIDFHELDPESHLPEVHRANIATAELTIRF